MKISGRKIDPGFLDGALMETIPCRLCGGEEFTVLSRKDCVGVPVRTVLCKSCGLIFLNPRPAKAWYEQFYSSVSGVQHRYKSSAHTDESRPIGWGFAKARRHGQGLAERLGQYMRPGVTIDVGSSEGGVLAGLRDRLPIEPVGIEPVPAEAAYAAANGIPTHAALIENIEALPIRLPAADNIVCVKSLNHFLDPAYFFSWAWRTLKHDGRLILEVKNFRHQVRRSGRVWVGVQLDHPYMYTPEILAAFVGAAGFRVLFLDVDEGKAPEALAAQKRLGLPAGHMRLAAAKTGVEPFRARFIPAAGEAARLRRALRPLVLYWHYLTRYATLRRNVWTRFEMFRGSKAG
ncbi:MAG: methyltransferase domain-containing protein [Candidatus Sungbacteria bacterium]|uniref:Methyltransferase domain-containing protein n=1 Tax=Candidatus Sungiibacteriota bacterium TaxID=2750080 RepID=A0A932YVY1_9BACT|nr:methyltransferase domain-containing protein [Candidatus Sungbacteria bacterium]